MLEQKSYDSLTVSLPRYWRTGCITLADEVGSLVNKAFVGSCGGGSLFFGNVLLVDLVSLMGMAVDTIKRQV